MCVCVCVHVCVHACACVIYPNVCQCECRFVYMLFLATSHCCRHFLLLLKMLLKCIVIYIAAWMSECVVLMLQYI